MTNRMEKIKKKKEEEKNNNKTMQIIVSNVKNNAWGIVRGEIEGKRAEADENKQYDGAVH